MIRIHVLNGTLFGFQQRAGIGNVGQKLRRLEVHDPAKTATRCIPPGRIRKKEKS